MISDHHLVYPAGNNLWNLAPAGPRGLILKGFESAGAAVDWVMRQEPCPEGHLGIFKNADGKCTVCIEEVEEE